MTRTIFEEKTHMRMIDASDIISTNYVIIYLFEISYLKLKWMNNYNFHILIRLLFFKCKIYFQLFGGRTWWNRHRSRFWINWRCRCRRYRRWDWVVKIDRIFVIYFGLWFVIYNLNIYLYTYIYIHIKHTSIKIKHIYIYIYIHIKHIHQVK